MQDSLHRRYDEYVLTAPRDSRGFPRAPTRAHLAKFVRESWDEVTPKVIIRSAIACGVARVCDYSPEVIAQYDLRSVKIDTIIRDVVSEGSEPSNAVLPAIDPQQDALESFANVVGLDLDDPDDRVHAEAMMNDSDEEMEADPHEDLETVPDSGSEFDTDGKNLSSSTMTFAED